MINTDPTSSGGVTLDARQFSSLPHAGTMADPWPESAIQQALMALPPTGGTVMLADGVWNIDSPIQINGANNFKLVGQSQNAQLRVTGDGQLWFNSALNPNLTMTGTISDLTIDDSNSSVDSDGAIRFSNGQNCSFNNNQILGCPNGSVPAVWFEGGSGNQFTDNTITSGPQGGASLQIQALGGTPNSGFVVSHNTFDSSNLLEIGLNNTQITNNYFSNKTQGNFIGILVCGPWTGTSQNITIDGNTLDAMSSTGWNGATISGIPNDPGGLSNINGLTITNNILNSTGSSISVQDYVTPDLTDPTINLGNKSNVTITGNQLSSLWGGSVIDISGGTTGSVNNVTVESNTLQNSAGQQNLITEDAHTTNATILNNSGAIIDPPGSVLGTATTDPLSGQSATLAGGSELAISTPDSSKVTFTGSNATLVLDQAATFSGTVAGFSASDSIDLSQVAFGANTTLGYSENSSHTGGTLTVSDGAQVAKVALLGQYIAGSFVTAADGHGGTVVTEASQVEQQPVITKPHA